MESPDGSAAIFESLTVGDLLPELTRGPLLEPHLMRWSAAIENWHRVHYDQRFAVDHDHLPGVLVHGSWKQHFLVEMIRRWAEPAGWLRAVQFDFREMDLAGCTLTAWAEVSRLSENGGFGWVGLTVGIRNRGTGRLSASGTATVVLPLAGGPPVPYPFPASLVESPVREHQR